MDTVSKEQVLQFQPRPAWFRREPTGIHGISHETRVLIWTQILAKMACADGLDADAEVLGWAAAIHDTQRLNDGIDAEHGARAADWIEANQSVLPAHVPVDRVAYLCRWHVPSDAAAPAMTDELKVFKDADALDRHRIGDLDPSFLRTSFAPKLFEASATLWSHTRAFQNVSGAFENIVQTAHELGYIA